MAIQIFQTKFLLCDDEEFYKTLLKNYGVVIFGLKPQTKKRLPFLYIPTKDLPTVHIFPDQLSKVEYGTLEDENLTNFVKLTIKYRGKKVDLMMQMDQTSRKNFLVLMVNNYLTEKIQPRGRKRYFQQSKKPQHIPTEALKPFFSKFVSMVNRRDDEDMKKQEIFTNIADFRSMILYNNLIFKHSEMERKELIKYLKRELNNAPMFIKAYYPESNCDFWVFILKTFIVSHRCILQLQEKCSGYSLKKCSGCLVARYCSKQCQMADFKQHSTICEDLKDMNRSEIFFGESLETIIKERLPKISSLSISFSEFISLLSSKVFDASFNVIDKDFIQRLISLNMDTTTTAATETLEKADVSKLKMLLKEKALPREVILKQLQDTWGQHIIASP